MTKGENNFAINDVAVSNRDGGQFLPFRSIKDLAEEYLAALAITHEVVAEVDKQGKKFYQGPSPD